MKFRRHLGIVLGFFLLFAAVLTVTSVPAFGSEMGVSGQTNQADVIVPPGEPGDTTSDSVYQYQMPEQAFLPALFSTTGTVSGTVYDVATGEVIAGAKVTMGSLTTVTGDDGSYLISNIPVGLYDISVSISGYRNRTNYSQPVGGGQNIILNIALTLNNIPAANVEGYVCDALTGGNLSGVKITLADGMITHTDGYGHYTITDVPVGKSYPLSATCAGYYSRSVGNVIAGERVDFKMASQIVAVGSVSGKVTNATSGAGIARASVNAGFGLLAVTDNEGNYTLANVPEGSYCLQTYCGGAYEGATAQVSISSSTPQTQDFSLKPDPSAGYVYGRVLNAMDNSHMNGATVTIGGRTVVTDRQPGTNQYYYNEGYYELFGLPPGDYTLQVSKPGFVSRSTGAVHINSGQGTKIDITLTPSGTVAGTLTGMVKDAVTGNPVAGARVWVSDKIIVLSDADGNYTIPDLPTGNYDLHAVQSGYRERVISGIPITGGDNSWNIILTPGNISMANVEGYVRDALTGGNLSGVKISLADGMITHTNGYGHYTITDVPVGKSYPLSAGCTGYYPRSAGDVVAGENVDFSLAPQTAAVGSVSGKITNTTSGAGIARAWVNAGFGLLAVTDNEGNYTLANLPEGSYCLQAYCGGAYEGATAQVSISSKTPQTQDFSLKPDPSAGYVYGRVVNAIDHSYMNGTTVTIGGRTVVTDRQPGNYYDEGYYELFGLPPGDYTLQVSKPGFISRSTAAVHVNPGQGTKINITLTPSGTVAGALTGMVKDAVTGNSVAGARVWVSDKIIVLSDADGNYTIPNLPTSNYDLHAVQSGYRERVISGIPVTGGDNSWNIILTPGNISMANVGGYVRDALTGGNLSGVKISLADGMITHTDGYGRYTITDVPVGKSYPLSAGCTGYYPRSAGDVVAGENVDFSLAPQTAAVGSVSGKITNTTSGTGIARAWVNAGYGLLAVTDNEGNYTLANMPEGSYCLQAYCGGAYEGATAQVSISSSTPQTQDFSLKPDPSAGYVYGRVLNAMDNSHMNGATVTIGGRTVVTDRQPGTNQYYYNEGYYELFGLPPGDYTLQVSKPGFISRSTAAVHVNSGQGTKIDITLTPSGTVAGALTGMVKDAVTGNSVAGARVWVSDKIIVLSDADGNYTIPDLPTGNYDLHAVQSGYRERVISGIPITGGDNSWNIILTPGNISMANVEGYVRDALTGGNLSGVKISLADGMITYTDRYGRYTITDVPVGKSYPLSAGCTGYYPRLAGDVVAGENVDFSLAPQTAAVGSVSGKITNTTSGAGIARAWVNAGYGLLAVTDNEGNYTLANLPEGSYCLQVYCSGAYEGATAQVSISSKTPQTQDFSLKPNSSVSNMYGRVYGVNSELINGARVAVAGRTVSTDRQPGTNQYYYNEGYYEVCGLPAGDYDLVVSAPGYLASIQRIKINPFSVLNLDIHLAPRSDEQPIVEIYQPVNGTRLGGTVLVNGTATDEDFKDYRLEYAPASNPDDWHVITDQEIVPVVLGTLAQWDTTGLEPGAYQLRLTVTDQQNNQSQALITVVVRIPLTVTSITPDHWVTGCKAELTINGTGFIDGANVRVGNNTAEEVIFVGDKELRAVIPEINSPGVYDLVVVNPDSCYVRAKSVFTVNQGPVVFVSPPESGMGLDEDFTVEILVRDVANLYAGDIEVAYDPSVIELSSEASVELNTTDLFSTGGVTLVDNTEGKVRFSATRLKDQYGYNGYSGSNWLARIIFHTVGIGESSIVLNKAELRGNTGTAGSEVALVPVGRENGKITVDNAGSISGKVILEGVLTGKDLSGNIVSIEGNDALHAVTGPDGSYRLDGLNPGTYTLSICRPLEAVRPAYLKQGVAVTVYEGKGTRVDVLLLTGDVVSNNAVDLSDLVEMRRTYGKQQSDNGYNLNADLNWNDRVDLVDLVLLARNYGQKGYGE